MSKTIRPLSDRLLVERIEAQQKTAGGILIPDNAKEKPAEGRVVAVGTGKPLDDGTRRPVSLKENDRILFGKWSGTEVKLDGKDYLLVREDEVLAVLD